MGPRDASPMSRKQADWRAFAGRDWRAIEAETQQARVIAYRKIGPEVHHAIYLEIAESLLDRLEDRPWSERDPSLRAEDQRTHERLQRAFSALGGR